jgi:hypothetical protein
MEIVTEINESLLETRYPQRELTRTIHSTKRFGYQKSQNVWSIEFLPEIFWLFQKIGKNSYKNAGIILGYPNIFRNKFFMRKKFVYNCLLIFTRIYEKLAKN